MVLIVWFCSWLISILASFLEFKFYLLIWIWIFLTILLSVQVSEKGINQMSLFMQEHNNILLRNRPHVIQMKEQKT